MEGDAAAVPPHLHPELQSTAVELQRMGVGWGSAVQGFELGGGAGGGITAGEAGGEEREVTPQLPGGARSAEWKWAPLGFNCKVGGGESNSNNNHN